MSTRNSAARALDGPPKAPARPSLLKPVPPPPPKRTGELTNRFIARCRQSILRSILRLTERFPEDDPQDLVCRLRRAAASIPSAISEPAGRRGPSHLLDKAQSATAEVRYLATLSSELGYADERELEPLLARVSDIRRIVQHVRARTGNGTGGAH